MVEVPDDDWAGASCCSRSCGQRRCVPTQPVGFVHLAGEHLLGGHFVGTQKKEHGEGIQRDVQHEQQQRAFGGPEVVQREERVGRHRQQLRADAGDSDGHLEKYRRFLRAFSRNRCMVEMYGTLTVCVV